MNCRVTYNGEAGRRSGNGCCAISFMNALTIETSFLVYAKFYSERLYVTATNEGNQYTE